MVYFDYKKSDIKVETKNTLDSFLKQKQLLLSNPGISLSGHCDPRGSNDYNDSLSQSRINAVKEYLITNGIAVTIIKSEQALGKREPLNANSNEDEMALNRRVEISFQIAAPVAEVKKPEVKTLAEQIKDTSVKVGTNLVLKNLNFEGGRQILLSNSLPVLEELLETLKNTPSLHIAIEGHVCCAQGSPDGLDEDTKTYNLSVNRAKVVYDYLVRNGIDPARLSWDGYGNRYPITEERTEAERTINRRVEIKIVSK